MASFKQTNWNIYKSTGPTITQDTLYWKKLGVPALIKEFGPIDYIDFSPVEPHYFAVSCSVRVQLYNPITKMVEKNLSRFRESVYGGTFRSDGRLLCAGGDECHIKLFDIKTKSLLRVFEGHSSAVHRCFFTLDKTHIASFSDDKSVCLWDLPSEAKVTSFTEHADYIRAGAVSPVSSDIILSGSYDNTVRMFDTRINASVFTVDHGSPVESVLFLPSGGVFISAGSTEIRVWDAFAGGRLLAKLCQHHKTITCLCLASENKRLMSGSLDRHVKIYDTATYQVVHTMDYPSAVLSLDVSPDDGTVAAGMVDGLVSISRQEKEVKLSKQERKRLLQGYMPPNYVIVTTSVDMVVPESKNVRERFDNCLRKFQYTKALDYVLVPFVMKKNPGTTVSVFQELIRRKGLKAALAGRDNKSLSSLLTFFIKYIGDYRFTKTLIDVVNIFLDTYDGVEHSIKINKQFQTLAQRVKEQEELTEKLLALQGALQLLFSGASVEYNAENTLSLQPSENAQSKSIMNHV